MKTLFILALTLASSQAFAKIEPLHCDLGEMGNDNYVQIFVSEEAVEFGMHESHVLAEKGDFVKDGNTITITNKTLSGSAEGDDFTAVVNAKLVYDSSKNTMTVKMSMDGNTSIDAVLNCK